MNADVKKSIKILVITSVVLLGLGGAALALRLTGQLLWPCLMFELTGIYCLTCGSTRAAIALTRLDILGSLFLNPLPALIAIFLIALITQQIVSILRKKRREIPWMPATVIIIMAVELAFWLLRNVGVIPPI